MQKIIEQIKKKDGHIYINSSTGTGKTLSLLCSLLGSDHQRIIYCCRTHNQLKNVLDDFKITAYSNKNSICTLGSKKFMESDNCKCGANNVNHQKYDEVF